MAATHVIQQTSSRGYHPEDPSIPFCAFYGLRHQRHCFPDHALARPVAAAAAGSPRPRLPGGQCNGSVGRGKVEYTGQFCLVTFSGAARCLVLSIGNTVQRLACIRSLYKGLLYTQQRVGASRSLGHVEVLRNKDRQMSPAVAQVKAGVSHDASGR